MRRYTIASVIVSLFALPSILYGVYVNVSDECEYDFPLNRFLQIHAGVLCFLVAIPDVAWQIAKCRGIEIKESKLINEYLYFYIPETKNSCGGLIPVCFSNLLTLLASFSEFHLLTSYISE